MLPARGAVPGSRCWHKFELVPLSATAPDVGSSDDQCFFVGTQLARLKVGFRKDAQRLTGARSQCGRQLAIAGANASAPRIHESTDKFQIRLLLTIFTIYLYYLVPRNFFKPFGSISKCRL